VVEPARGERDRRHDASENFARRPAAPTSSFDTANAFHGKRPRGIAMKSLVLAGLSLAAVIAAGLPVPPAVSGDIQAGEIKYVSLFDGSWSGSGMIVRNGTSLEVSCRAQGQALGNHLSFAGDCSLGFVSMKIAADIRYDPTSGRYVGSYLGDPVGVAGVSGKRSGDVVNFDITWPKIVNGDTRARMMIVNSGGGSLRIVVFDNVAPGGREQWTSDLRLSSAPPTIPVARAQ
jgi:hypothetical protein